MNLNKLSFLAAVICLLLVRPLFSKNSEVNFLDMSTDTDIENNLPNLLNSSNAGTEFWLTFHPNNTGKTSIWSNSEVKLYITSSVITDVTLEIPGIGLTKDVITKPDDVVSFTLNPFDAQPYLKNSEYDDPREQQVFSNRAIHIFSEKPIVVYGVSYGVANEVPSVDGFLGIPTNGYGKDYIVPSWQDYTSDTIQHTSYVSIIGVYEDTEVEFTLGGAPTNYTIEPGRMETGDSKRRKLEPGDVWVIGTKGEFNDVTGSIVSANKPVSVFSGSYCTSTINKWNNFLSKDYLIEHIQPISNWGKKYHVTPIKTRKKASMLRIFASEKNTTIYRNGEKWGFIGNIGGKENEGWLSRRAIDENAPNPTDPVTITADKPIQVVQYNPSAGDDWVDFDPFMMILEPTDRYYKSTKFCVPGDSYDSDKNFNDNYINVIYKSDSLGRMPDFLEYGIISSGKIEWVPFRTVYKGGASYKIEDSDISDGRYWRVAQHSLPNPKSVYAFRSSENFMIYGYGRDVGSSYGYPIGGCPLKIDEEPKDTLAPVAEFISDCFGNVEGYATDLPNVDTIRSNFEYFSLDKEESYNYELLWEEDEFVDDEIIKIRFQLNIIDENKNGKAVLIMRDKNGNETEFEYDYHPTMLQLEPFITNWGRVAYNDTSETKTISLYNPSDKSVTIDSLLLVTQLEGAKDEYNGFRISNSVYKENGGELPGYELEAGGSFEFEVVFNPSTVPELQMSFIDSIFVKADYIDETKTYCYEKTIGCVKANFGSPVISVSDLDFGTTEVNIGEAYAPTLTATVRNNGNATLTISEVINPESIFKHDWSEKDFPVKIDAGEYENITVSFIPTTTGEFNDTIKFISNSNISNSKHDHILELSGSGVTLSKYYGDY